MLQLPASGSLVAILLVIVSAGVLAQEPMASRDKHVPGHVAVVDMQKLLAEYEPFASRIRQLRTAEQEHGKWIEKHQNIVDERRRRTKEIYAPNTPQYRKILGEIELYESHITVERKTFRHAVEVSEARLYMAYYKLATEKIATFAKKHNISIVLNRPVPKIDANCRAEAESLFGQHVVYENNIDITNDILDALDKAEEESPPAITLPEFVAPEPVVLAKEVKE